ncbi:MAG: hypothetical protein U9N51_10935 [Bacteroidota bacterium]|nr:hypothetical protein [Bacteroidota bacterium]
MKKIQISFVSIILCFLLFIGTKTTNAQISMRLMETIATDSLSQETSCVYYNGNMLIVGNLDGTVEFWNYTKKEIIKTFKGHTAEITAVTLNNAGTYIASASKDNTIKLWRIKSGEEVYSFNRDNSIIVLIKTLIFNDKLNTLISIDEYNNIQTWNTNGLMYK